jgi:hypothetical protein
LETALVYNYGESRRAAIAVRLSAGAVSGGPTCA